MNYGIYIARIEQPALPADSRLTVRILPHMADFDISALPRWPHFFRGEFVTSSKTANEALYVWVLANNDFTIGYVLGYSNVFTSEGSYTESSLPAELFRAVEDASVQLGNGIPKIENMTVTYWDGNSVHFINTDNGAHYTAFRNGTIHIVAADQVSFKVGATSMFKMDANEIRMNAKIIRLSGEVRLGDAPSGKVLISNGGASDASVTSTSVWG